MTRRSHEDSIFSSSIDVTAGMGGPLDRRPADPGPQSGLEALSGQLADLVAVTRELLSVAKEQLHLARLAEGRFQHQNRMQREDFERWVAEYPDLKAGSNVSQEVVRELLGRSMADLSNYVEEHQDLLADGESDFIRSELCDKFGSTLQHLGAMYGLLRRITAVGMDEE